MKIAIISDIHENSHNLRIFLKEAEKLKVEKIIFLGDFIAKKMAGILAFSKIPSYAIWGNNDGNKLAITRLSLSSESNMKCGLETFDIIELDSRKIFITHYPILAKPMAKSGDFDAVFFGHNHRASMEKINDCLLLNPGEIGAVTGKASFALYDTKTNQSEIIFLQGIVAIKFDIGIKDYIE